MNINGSARIGWRTATIAALGLASLSCVRGAKPAAAASQAIAPQAEAFYGGRAFLLENRCGTQRYLFETIDGVPAKPGFLFRITPGESPTDFSLRISGWLKPVEQNDYLTLGIRIYNPEQPGVEKGKICCESVAASLSFPKINRLNNNPYVVVNDLVEFYQRYLPKKYIIELSVNEPVEAFLTVTITPRPDLPSSTIKQ